MEGTSGSRHLPFFAEERVKQPWAPAVSARATRERHPAPATSAFRGGVRVVGASRRWSLRPARRLSHDERCPNGSGRVKQAHGRPQGRACLRTWLRPGRTWLVKLRLVAVAAGIGIQPGAQALPGIGIQPGARALPGIQARSRPRPRRRTAPPVFSGGRSSGEASAAPRRGRVQRASACWPGPSLGWGSGDRWWRSWIDWLQKSTSGARAGRKARLWRTRRWKAS